MIKSPCCPGNSAEDLAFTLFVIEQEKANSLHYFDYLDDIYSDLEFRIQELEASAEFRKLSDDEIDLYLYLCKQIGSEPNYDYL